METIEGNNKFVAYYRVSTQKQGKSGLGLEAQKAIVRATVRDGEILQEFIEVESGKNADRQELRKALALAKDTGAKLVIAKLDRLSRDVNFIFTLRTTGVNFVACDLPDFNTMTLAIFAGMAQHERELISQRTKAALAVKKAQGCKLGSPKNNLTPEARLKAAESKRKKAIEIEANKKAFAIAKDLRKSGLTLQAIADKLNEYGMTTSTGKAFIPQTIQQLFALYGAKRLSAHGGGVRKKRTPKMSKRAKALKAFRVAMENRSEKL